MKGVAMSAAPNTHTPEGREARRTLTLGVPLNDEGFMPKHAVSYLANLAKNNDMDLDINLYVSDNDEATEDDWETEEDYESRQDYEFRNQVNEVVGWDDDPKEDEDLSFDGDSIPLPQGPIQVILAEAEADEEVVDPAAIEAAAKAGKTTAEYWKKAHQMKLEALKEKRAAAKGNGTPKVVDISTASKRRKKANGQAPYALKDCYTTSQVGRKLFGSVEGKHIQPLYRSYWKNKFGAFQVDPLLSGSTLHWPKETVDGYINSVKQKLDR